MNIINRIPKYFPLDPIKHNDTRIVNQYCFSQSNPTPIDNPKLICVSDDCLQLINIKNIDQQFINYFSGNTTIPNSIPLTHCYSGYQFGIFAGQLGDGRAHLIGDTIHDNEYYEIQLKGSGLTPYSRSGDGRAVLRSSVREFLCSEVMNYLGIPTTRAGSIITSDTIAIRDKQYDGNISYEKVTVVLRIAPSFIRFGSFNVVDENGPHKDNIQTIKLLTDYVINNYYPNIATNNALDEQNKIISFMNKVIENTAIMVAMWQSYGFVHGVLNTDNMSILGITMDYGPFAFMETYDPNMTSNTSDNNSRYSFKNQPRVCKWNLLKLAQSIGKYYVNIKDELIKIVDNFCIIYRATFHYKMLNKLGFGKEFDGDKQMIDSFLELLQESQADYTNIFRSLLNLHLFDNNDTGFYGYLKSQCKNFTNDVQNKWTIWLDNYKKTTINNFNGDIDKCVFNRISLLENNNPKFILRNSMLQKAIDMAEKGNYNEVTNLLNLSKLCYCETNKYGKNEYLNIDSNIKISLSCSS